MIKAVFFDLDDTLLWDQKSVKEAFRETCLVANKKYGVDVNEFEEAVRKSAAELYASYETYEFTKLIGINPFEGLWGNFLDDEENFRKMKEIVPTYRKEAWTKGLLALGIDDPALGEELAERFPIERKKNPFVYEETYQVLDKLKENYKLLLLTNGSPDLQNTKLTITPELVPYFEHILISGAFGKGKPDPKMFEHALSLGYNKEEVIMVGDNLMTDILGATRVGIKSVWVNRHDKDRDETVVPTYEIKHLEQLFEILDEINGK